MNIRKTVKVGIPLLVALALVMAIILLVNPFSNATRHPALLSSTWGMSPTEVEKALGVSLSKDLAEPWFDVIERPIANRNRFASFGISTSQFTLWNLQTTVYFNFFDDKLYQYVVQLTSTDSLSLDSIITSQLSSKYGPPHHSEKPRWHSDLARVEYWMISWRPTAQIDFRPLQPNLKRLPRKKFDPSTARPLVGTIENGYYFRGGDPSDESNWIKISYRGIVRVTYLPIEDQIKDIAKEEKKKIF